MPWGAPNGGSCVCPFWHRRHGLRYHLCRRVTNPFGYLLGPGGSSTNPSVPARDVKSPDPLVGEGMAQARPQSSTSIRIGMKSVSSVRFAISPPRAIFSGGSTYRERHTTVETGFPGSANTVAPEAATPNHIGLPGRWATV